MADLSELKEKLVKVEKALNNKALPEAARPALEKKQAELKKDITEAEEATKKKIVKPKAEKKPIVKSKEPKKKIKLVKQKKEVELTEREIRLLAEKEAGLEPSEEMYEGANGAYFFAQKEFGAWDIYKRFKGGKIEMFEQTDLARKADADKLAEKWAEKDKAITPEKKTELKGYVKSIVEATNCSAEDAKEVEEIMRNDIFHSTLDWVPKPEFDKAAKEGYEQLLFMRSPEGKKYMKETEKEMEKIEGKLIKKIEKAEVDDISECKKILEAANYDVKQKVVKTKNGKKTIRTREPRQDRSIITDRTKSIFTTITKSYASEEEKTANKELLDTVESVKDLMIKFMNSLDKLVGSKDVDKIKKIKALLAKLVD